jgi:hypothetical protein
MKTNRYLKSLAALCLALACAGSFTSSTRAAPAQPGAFSKTYPLDAAGELPVSLMLQWEVSSGAIDYDYCLETPVDGSCDTWQTGLTDNQAPVSDLTPWTSYEWQVRANDMDGRTSYANGGVLWTFNTNLPLDWHTMLPLIVRPEPPPDAFGKLTPENSASALPTSPTLDWEDAAGAAFYEYCYDTSLNGSCSGTWTSTGPTSQAELSGLAYNSSYEWQVRADNGHGALTFGDSGSWWSFSTAAAAWTIVTSEDFEGAFPRSGWSRQDRSIYDGGDFLIGQRDCNVDAGAHSGWMVGGGANGSIKTCGESYNHNVDSWFVYGPFSTVGASVVEMDYDFYLDSIPDTHFLWVMASETNVPANFYGVFRSGSLWPWQTSYLDLSQDLCEVGTATCLNRPSVYIAFVFTSYDSGGDVRPYGALLDNITLFSCMASTCPGMAAHAAPSFFGPPGWRELLEPFRQALTGFGRFGSTH